MEERRKQTRRQADRALQTRLQELEQLYGDTPTRDLRQRRRRAIRHNCTIHLALEPQQASGFGDSWEVDDHPIKGRVLDLSAEGCSIFTPEPLEQGRVVSMLITIRSGSKFHAEGAVRWCRPVALRDGYASGLHFEQIQQKDLQLIQGFLKELDETSGL